MIQNIYMISNHVSYQIIIQMTWASGWNVGESFFLLSWSTENPLLPSIHCITAYNHILCVYVLPMEIHVQAHELIIKTILYYSPLSLLAVASFVQQEVNGRSQHSQAEGLQGSDHSTAGSQRSWQDHHNVRPHRTLPTHQWLCDDQWSQCSWWDRHRATRPWSLFPEQRALWPTDSEWTSLVLCQTKG